MVSEAIPQKGLEGFFQRFGEGGRRAIGQAPEQIAAQQLQNERARIFNTLSKLDLMLKNSKDPNTGNTAAIKFLLDSKVVSPEQAGQLDFTKTIQKNLGGQQPFQLPKGFEPSGVTVGAKGGISQSFKPKLKPKPEYKLDELDNFLYQRTHQQKPDKTVEEIELSEQDRFTLAEMARKSGYWLVWDEEKGWHFVPITKPSKKKSSAKAPSQVDVTRLTDEQIDAIIENK